MYVRQLTVLALLAAAPAFAQESSVVATVNGEPISRAEFDALSKRRQKNVLRPVSTNAREEQMDVLNVLVDDLLLKQFLRSSTPAVEKADIDRQLAALESALKAQHRTMTEYCNETQQTREELRANVTAVLQWKTYAAAKLTDAELKQYFLDNKTFFDRATVRASHIVIRVRANDPDRPAATQKLEALRRDIVAGKISFADAAKKHSQCPSAPRGGDLGYIPRKGMVDETFAKTAFAMTPGSVSEVIATENAVRLVTVIDKKPGSAAFYEDPRIRADVRECATEEMRQRLIGELRAKAKVEVLLN